MGGEGPGVNTRGLVMVGPSVWREHNYNCLPYMMILNFNIGPHGPSPHMIHTSCTMRKQGVGGLVLILVMFRWVRWTDGWIRTSIDRKIDR